MVAYRPGLRTARAASAAVARNSTAVPSQVTPLSDSNGRRRSARPVRAARQGRPPAPSRGRAPGTGCRRWGRRRSPTWRAPAGCATGGAARHGTRLPVVRLVEGERAGGGGTGQAENVHAAGGSAVAGQGRAAGDHLRLVLVHVRPVLFQQFVAQRRSTGPVAVVTEELHANRISANARWPSRGRPWGRFPPSFHR